MYQEWEDPSFSIEQLIELCTGFFHDHDFAAKFENRKKDKTLIIARIEPIGENATLVIEQKKRRLKLTFLPLSHSSDGLARLGGFLVTGRTFKAEAEKQLFLDRLEQQFWDNLDRKLPEISGPSSSSDLRR